MMKIAEFFGYIPPIKKILTIFYVEFVILLTQVATYKILDM